MWLPSSDWAGYLLAALSCLCWGSWSNTMVAAQGMRLRWQLYVYDWLAGALLLALAAAFTAGEAGSAGAGVSSNLGDAAAVRVFYAAAGGAVFGLANLLLVVGIRMGGMAAAFPLCIGTALSAGTALDYLIQPEGSAPLLFAGVALSLLAVGAMARAHSLRPPPAAAAEEGESKLLESPAAAASAAPPPPCRAAGRRRMVAVSLAGGALMACWSPLTTASMNGPGQLTAYSSFLVYTLAAAASTVAFNGALMRHPIDGESEPMTERAYLAVRVPAAAHLWGVAGGAVWGVGTLANILAGGKLGFAAAFALGQSSPLVGSVWGLLWWREFDGAPPPAFRWIGAVFALYAGAIACVALSAAV